MMVALEGQRARRLLKAVRLMSWFGPDRARSYSICVVLAAVPTLIYYHHVAVTAGEDFAAFWAAGRLAWSDPSASYHLEAVQALQTWIPHDSLLPFVNPPPFLLLVAPLGLLPFWLALEVFKAIGVALFAAATRGLRAFWPSLAFGSTLANLITGQNGLLTGSLFIGAARLLDRRPLLAGALFGALIIKPQVALLVPAALLFGGRWRAILGAAVSSLGLLALSWAVFGTEAFRAFWSAMAMRAGLFGSGLEKMQTVFAMATTSGLDKQTATALQIASALAAALTVAIVWRGRHDTETKCAVLGCATVFATPYLYSYDLVLTFLPIVWLARRDAPLPWERLIIGLAFVSPLVSPALSALTFGVNIGPAISGLLLLAVLRRLAVMERGVQRGYAFA